MTHTLHRRIEDYVDDKDFVILSMACQKYNDQGAGEKLKKIYTAVSEAEPDNLADDNIGGRFTGLTDQQIIDHMGDKAYIGAAFSDRDRLKKALKKIKQLDLGMSVVVSGNYEKVFEVLKEIGIKPHTVNMSLGVFGKQSKLPKDKLIPICTMCGHGMVTQQRVESVMSEVQSGRFSPNKGGEELASNCTCGIFNPKLAAAYLAASKE